MVLSRIALYFLPDTNCHTCTHAHILPMNGHVSSYQTWTVMFAPPTINYMYIVQCKQASTWHKLPSPFPPDMNCRVSSFLLTIMNCHSRSFLTQTAIHAFTYHELPYTLLPDMNCHARLYLSWTAMHARTWHELPCTLLLDINCPACPFPPDMKCCVYSYLSWTTMHGRTWNECHARFCLTWTAMHISIWHELACTLLPIINCHSHLNLSWTAMHACTLHDLPCTLLPDMNCHARSYLTWTAMHAPIWH